MLEARGVSSISGRFTSARTTFVIAIGIVVDPATDATRIARSIVEAKARIQDVVPYRTVVLIEPRLATAETSDDAASG